MDPCLIIKEYVGFFSKRFIAQKVCTACSRTSYIIVPLTNLNKYLRNETSETEGI